jgi:hypothetical protein
MNLAYTVKGADGNEYGPATLHDINTWLREGRINGATQIKRSDVDYWAPAANFTEFEVPQSAAPMAQPAAARPVTAQPAGAAAVRSGDPATEAQLRSGASWFYWNRGAFTDQLPRCNFRQ